MSRCGVILVSLLIGTIPGCNPDQSPSAEEDTAILQKQNEALSEAPTIANRQLKNDDNSAAAETQENASEQPRSPANSTQVGDKKSPAYTNPSTAPRSLPANTYEREPDWRAKLAAERQIEARQIAVETARRAAELGIPLRVEGPDGYVRELSHFEGDKPIYRETRNVNAAISTGADLIRDAAPFVDGTGFSVGVWDGGSIRTTHQEFGNRVVNNDGVSADNHATHVGGTIGAAGMDPTALGMAPEVGLESYNWNNDRAEMGAVGASYPGEAATLYLSNHSYGFGRGWVYDTDAWRFFGDSGGDQNGEDEAFGQYSAYAAGIDDLSNEMPYYLIFWASGNDRNDGPTDGAAVYLTTDANSTTPYDSSIHPKGDGVWRDGYENIADESIAKNVVAIGAVNDAVSSGSRNISSATMSNFSTWGPADDGRIKPDLVANGVNLRSPVAGSDTAYSTYSGTSMATPNAVGSAVLLVHYFDTLFPGHAMRASTLKGLLIHTADDVGPVGPDYQNGFGLINVKAGADHITAYYERPQTQRIREGRLTASNPSDTLTITSDGTQPIRVTLTWTDPTGSISNAADDHTPVLVNDLDIRVTGPAPDQTDHYPYVMPFALDSNNLRSALAVQAENNVDTVEVIDIPNPIAGDYTITIDYDGTLANASGQVYSLFISGDDETAGPITPTISSLSQLATGAARITGSGFLLGANVTLTNGGTEVAGTGIQVNPSQIDFLYDASVVTNLGDWSASVTNPVSPLTNPIITLNSSTFSYTGNTGSSVPDQTFTIENTGADFFNYTISSDSAWLSVSPTTGTSSSSPDTITVSVDTAGLAAGEHIGTLTIASNEAANAPRTLTYTLQLKPPIGEAIDNAGLTYTNDPNHPWNAVLVTDAVGGSALESGGIGNLTTTTFSTEIAGPGLLTFNWKVSSETDFDFLRVYLDGELKSQISGIQQDWKTVAFNIPPGIHSIQWSYEKDTYSEMGDDRGWIDNVQFKDTSGYLVTLLTDGFNSNGLNPVWTTEIVTDTANSSPALDVINTSVNPIGFDPVEGDGFLRFNSFDCDPGVSIRLKTTSPLSTAEYSAINATFSWTRDNEYAAQDSIALQWSTDGTTWQSVGQPILRLRENGSDEWLLYDVQFPQEAVGSDIYIALLLTGDYGNDCHIDDFKLFGLSNNSWPQSVSLDTTSLDENSALRTVVGSFDTVDSDTGDNHTYSFVSGIGDSDNIAFSLDGNQLLTAQAFDFESKNTYSLRVRATDTYGAYTEASFSITVNDVNDAPTTVLLNSGNATSIDENQPSNTLVGQLSSTDADAAETFAYSLVQGEGDADNSSFTVNGIELRTASMLDFESKETYTIRIRSTDTGGLFTEDTFTITVNDLNEPPTAILLNGNASASIIENLGQGALVASLGTVDPDTTDSHTYSLAAGEGDTDNASFSISADQLLSAQDFDFEAQSSYSVRIRSTDAAGLFVETPVIISITDTNESPQSVSINNSTTISIDENLGTDVLIGNLSTVDPDTDDTHTYTLVSGDGDTDNVAFSVTANQLFSATSFDFETKNSYSLRIRSTDTDGLYVENIFTVSVADLNEPPTDISLGANSFSIATQAGSEVATLSSVDPDIGDTISYSLVSGAGDTDNSRFQISDSNLVLITSVTEPTQLSIRLAATDSGGLVYETALTLYARGSATITLADLSHIYDGNPKEPTVTTDPQGLAYSITFDGEDFAPSNAGNYTVITTITDPLYEGTGTDTLTIGPASASINFGTLTLFHDGAPKPVEVTTIPEGLATTLTYDGSSTPPTEAGNYTVEATINESNYTGSTSDTLTISYAQTIELLPPSAIGENHILEVPVKLHSLGNIAGLTLELSFDNTYLRNPTFVWDNLIAGGSVVVDEQNAAIEISVALSESSTFPSGETQIGTLYFVVGSGLNGTVLQLLATTISLTYTSSAQIPTTTAFITPNISISQRTIPGDANNNGSLDVADGAEILRLIGSAEGITSWDAFLNDLNGDSQLDAEDVAAVLSVITGLQNEPDFPSPASETIAINPTALLPQPVSLPADWNLGVKWQVISSTEAIAEVFPTKSGIDLSGLSFIMTYPATLLRIPSAAELTAPGLPETATVVWNILPDNTFSSQDGKVHFASSWDSGVDFAALSPVVRVTFEVIPGADSTVHLETLLQSIILAPTQSDGPASPISLSEVSSVYTRSYDDWAASVFGTLNELPDSDYDSDGQSNFDEYLASTDPTNPMSIFTAGYSHDTTAGSFSLQLNSVFGVQYQLQTSPDLQTWSPASPEIANPNTVTGDGSILEFVVPEPGNSDPTFFRLEVIP